jgi:Fe-S cluster assembly protein SufD
VVADQPGKPPRVVPPELDAIDHAVGEHAAMALVRDGHVVHVEVAPKYAAMGLVVVDAASDAAADDPGGLLAGPTTDAFTELNNALSPSPLVISVPEGVVIEHPVLVLQWTAEAGGASFPRTVVRAGAHSQLTVVEYQGSDQVRALTAPVVELEAGDDAVVRYLGVQNLGPEMWQVGYQAGRVGRQASLASANVALGGHYARLRVDAELAGEGGGADLVAVYFGDGEQMHDFRTLQEHRAPRTSSDLLFKGAVTGLAHSVYTGLIRVNEGAAGTSAFLTNRNIVLSEGARAYSVPNLEIINENDLRNCGHASASGPIDDDQLFYLESRGVPRDTAERLIVLGFFDDILGRTPLPGLRRRLGESVTAKFDRARNSEGTQP